MRLLKQSGLFVAALGFAISLAAPVEAFETKTFDAESFKAAQGAGKPILIDVRASWCHVCKEQHQALQLLDKKPEFAALTVFEVDFDGQKDAVRSFDARRQSTLIAFKGATETGRLVADTKPEAIEALLTTTLKK
jgi:thiol-disulfide isomerase/thioredoxin